VLTFTSVYKGIWGRWGGTPKPPPVILRDKSGDLDKRKMRWNPWIISGGVTSSIFAQAPAIFEKLSFWSNWLKNVYRTRTRRANACAFFFENIPKSPFFGHRLDPRAFLRVLFGAGFPVIFGWSSAVTSCAFFSVPFLVLYLYFDCYCDSIDEIMSS